MIVFCSAVPLNCFSVLLGCIATDLALALVNGHVGFDFEFVNSFICFLVIKTSASRYYLFCREIVSPFTALCAIGSD